MMSKSTKGYIAEVDGLRAVAVLGVLFYHYFKQLLPGGLIGVDVFFVISGYLITRILLEDISNCKLSLFEFYARRVKRIFPALILVLLVTFLVGFCILTSQEFEQLSTHILWSNFFLLNLKLMREVDYFNNAAETKPLLHLWSLSIEEQFYIIFPFILLMLQRIQRFILPIVIGLSIISFWFCISHGLSEDAIAENYFHPFSRFWELLIGSTLAALQRQFGRDLRLKLIPDNFLNVIGVFALLALLLSNIFIKDTGSYPNKYVLIPTLATVVIIAINSRSQALVKILSNPGMVLIGKISYPLYLWHWPVLSFVRVFLNYPPSPWQKIAAMLLSLLLAFMTYLYLERVIQKRDLKQVSMRLLSGMLVIAVFIGLNNQFAFMVPNFNAKLNHYSQTSEFYAFDKKLSENKHLLEDLRQERQRKIRGGLCHYHPKEQLFEQYLLQQPDCASDLSGTGLQTLLIGDSFAADMFMGVQALNRYSILQLTGQGCTATLGHYKNANDNCYQLIKYGFNKLMQDSSIDQVILASRWKEKDLQPLINDIRRLSTSGKKIVVIGPGLELTDGLYNILYRRSSEDDSNAITQRYVRADIVSLNNAFKRSIEEVGAVYIDRIKPLCTSNRCQFMSPEGDIYMWDNGHLTYAGAVFLAKKLFQ